MHNFDRLVSESIRFGNPFRTHSFLEKQFELSKKKRPRRTVSADHLDDQPTLSLISLILNDDFASLHGGLPLPNVKNAGFENREQRLLICQPAHASCREGKDSDGNLVIYLACEMILDKSIARGPLALG